MADFGVGTITGCLATAVIGTRAIMQLRRESLRDVRGDVLELGIGGGLNLACYPPAVTHITAIDPDTSGVARSALTVDLVTASAEEMAFPRERFDTVVSTFCLCSIPALPRALAEVRRVLRPGGQFLYLEHGIGTHPLQRAAQQALTPVFKLLAGGCHLNRDHHREVGAAGLRLTEQRVFPSPDLRSRSLMTLYQGRAVVA